MSSSPVWGWPLLALWWPAVVGGCRWVMYVGSEEMDAAGLLVRPAHNLMTMGTERAAAHTPGARSSPRWNASEFGCRNVDENLDGWGVSWYVDGSAYPRRVRSAEAVASGGRPHGELLRLVRGVDPLIPYMATNNSCVSDLPDARRGPLRSRAIVGHVRAASTGGLDKRNSHPFVFNTLAWVHNGAIAAFDDIKERFALPPEVRSLVAGETDSELAGAVFVDRLNGFPLGHYTLDHLRAAMRTTLKAITETNEDFDDANSLNFGVTDGRALVAARYRSNPRQDPPTLYYKLTPGPGIIVASEPLDTDPAALLHWTLLGKDRLLSFSPAAGLLVECVDPTSPACAPDLPAAERHPDGSLLLAP